MFEDFEFDLRQKKKEKLYREIPCFNSLLDFTSNDYLSLAQHPQIRSEILSLLKKKVPLSSSGSALLVGKTYFHKEAEKTFKNFIQRPATLSFSSGYQANLGVLPALAKNRVIFSDESNHASLIDGIRLSKRPYHIFQHNDLNHLEDLMKKESKPKLIVTESLFSMSGDFSDLKSLSQLALKYNSLLFVDEAHSTGLFGKNLSGRVSQLKKKDHIITLHTGGKALASSGAFIACSPVIKDYLVNHCRSFIYSTAPSPLLMIQWIATLKILKQEAYRAEILAKKALKTRRDFDLAPTKSPILFISLKTAEKSLKVSQALRKQNYFIPAIRYPTVSKENQGLRLILHFNHTEEQIDLLKKIIKRHTFF
ncbi:MAG: pyridoxal phosphate-dependent aminotransferase family protein [Bdellovibrionales bacterium]|nr:pyridoxal phosphate-dependent aminotransferase family protein [Bdellovibrionales bacterium]